MTDEGDRQRERAAREEAERRVREAQAEERSRREAEERARKAHDDDDWDPRRPEERHRP